MPDIVNGFDPDDYRVREDAGAITLPVRVLSGTLCLEQTADLITLFAIDSAISKKIKQTHAENDTALSSIFHGSIYIHNYTTVVNRSTFNSTTTSVDIQVPIVDAVRMICSMGSLPTPCSDPRVTLSPNQANVTIEDNGDGK